MRKFLSSNLIGDLFEGHITTHVETDNLSTGSFRVMPGASISHSDAIFITASSTAGGPSIKFMVNSGSVTGSDKAAEKYVVSGSTNEETANNFANKISTVLDGWISATTNSYNNSIVDLTASIDVPYNTNQASIPMTASSHYRIRFSNDIMHMSYDPNNRISFSSHMQTSSFNPVDNFISGSGTFGILRNSKEGIDPIITTHEHLTRRSGYISLNSASNAIFTPYENKDSGSFELIKLENIPSLHSSSNALFTPYLQSASLNMYYPGSSSEDSSYDKHRYLYKLDESRLFQPFSGTGSRQIADYEIYHSKHPYLDWGTGVNDTWIMHMGVSGSNSDYNTGYMSDANIIYTIGDFEVISSSIIFVNAPEFGSRMSDPGNVDNIQNSVRLGVPVTDFTDMNTHKRRKILDVGKGFRHRDYIVTQSGVAPSTLEIDGRPMGRTAYFATSSTVQGEILYPDNHYVNAPTSKGQLNHLFYEGIIAGQSESRYTDPLYQHPEATGSVNIREVKGTGTDTALKVTRRQSRK